MSRDLAGGRRQAALLLHALGERDRAWMLAALPKQQREALQPLLAELDELGMPRDPALLTDLLAQKAPGSIPEVDEASAADVAALLQREPPRLVSVLMASAAWRGQAQRLGITTPLPTRDPVPAAPALEQAVLGSVQRALAARAPAGVPRTRRPKLWSLATRRLRGMRGAA